MNEKKKEATMEKKRDTILATQQECYISLLVFHNSTGFMKSSGQAAPVATASLSPAPLIKSFPLSPLSVTFFFRAGGLGIAF